MNDTLFENIIEKCSSCPSLLRIMPYLMNEPLMDSKIVKRINHIKKRVPWADVHILTNGTLLGENLTDELLVSGLDWIGFSVHANRDETYKNITGLRNFSFIREKILRFIDKASRTRTDDFIEIKIIKAGDILSEEEKEETIDFWKNQGVKRIVYHDIYLSRAGNVDKESIISHKYIYGCKTVWANEILSILFNGDVVPCCMDWGRINILGNVDKISFKDIWQGIEYVKFRKMCQGEIASPDDFICKCCEDAVTDKI